jgi:hypothetical protein
MVQLLFFRVAADLNKPCPCQVDKGSSDMGQKDRGVSSQCIADPSQSETFCVRAAKRIESSQVARAEGVHH